jgi:hypothetical protein
LSSGDFRKDAVERIIFAVVHISRVVLVLVPNLKKAEDVVNALWQGCGLRMKYVIESLVKDIQKRFGEGTNSADKTTNKSTDELRFWNWCTNVYCTCGRFRYRHRCWCTVCSGK